MIASGEAPVRSKAGALLSPAALVISSFIMHGCPTQKDMTRSSTVCFLPVLDDSFSVLPFSKLSRLREAPTVRSAQCDCPRDAAAEWSRQFEASDKIRNNYGHGSKRHFCLPESPISKPPNGPFGPRNPAARNGISGCRDRRPKTGSRDR